MVLWASFVELCFLRGMIAFCCSICACRWFLNLHHCFTCFFFFLIILVLEECSHTQHVDIYVWTMMAYAKLEKKPPIYMWSLLRWHNSAMVESTTTLTHARHRIFADTRKRMYGGESNAFTLFVRYVKYIRCLLLCREVLEFSTFIQNVSTIWRLLNNCYH